MQALFYDKNGKILRQVEAPEDYLVMQKQPDEFILFGSANDAIQYIDVEMEEIRDIPIKPNDCCEFNWQTKQWEDNSDIAKQQVLAKRQQLLSESDWTDTFSASTRLTNYEEWQVYRQALRDITQQSDYPFVVIWPEQPA